jgi:hypothetical protein
VLATLQDDILRPTVIDQALALALEELEPAGVGRVRRRLEADLANSRTNARGCQRPSDAAADCLPFWTV